METRIINDHRFFTMPEFEQLVFMKLLVISRITQNKIPKDFDIISALLRTNRKPTDIESAINIIKDRFPKFKENKYFYRFEGYDKRLVNNTPISSRNTGVDEDEDKEEDKDKEIRGKKVLPLESPFLKSPVFLTAWGEFLIMRKTIKKPATERAKQLLLNKLAKFTSNPIVAVQILEQSTVSCWQDVYELKASFQTKKPPRRYDKL